jgi:type IV secretory pathway VirD2 relaxase
MKPTKAGGRGSTQTLDDTDIDLEQEASLRLKGSTSTTGKLTFRGYRQIMKVVQDGKRMAKRGRRRAPNSKMMPPRPSKSMTTRQQVAVRLTYARNKIAGQWGAHGKYIERESATQQQDQGRGFDANGDQVPVAAQLDAWQKDDDPNLFKLIISPEKGRELDLREYTREYMARVGRELGADLQWVAADHYNTDDPHVHVALRGRDRQGRELRIPPEFIKGPLRDVAMDLATQKLGYRTAQDIFDARERQVTQHRFTDLDRALGRVSQVQPDGSRRVDFSKPVSSTSSDNHREMRMLLLKRLAVLESLGLASRGTSGVWRLEGTTETLLRERQKANDRLKVMYSHRALASDARMPLAPLPSDDDRIMGRLLGTGLDDATGRAYMLLESTRGSVHYIYQTQAAETARREGLNVGDAVIVSQRQFTGNDGTQRTTQKFIGLGPADAVLADPKRVETEVRSHIRRHGTLPQPSTWGGWVGDYHKAVAREARQMQIRGEIKLNGSRYEVQQRGRTGQSPQRP